MPAPDETTTTTVLHWYFTEAQARNVTINQIAGGEPLQVTGSWVFGAASQTVRATVDLDTSSLENALTGAQADDHIQVFELLPSHPEFANGNRFEVTATRTVTV